MNNVIGHFKTTLNRATFKWVTMERKTLTLQEMETSHIFNSLKMLYNHLAVVYQVPTVWFNKQYSNLFKTIRELISLVNFANKIELSTHRMVAEIMILFIIEIEARQNLPEKYQSPYDEIIKNIQDAIGKNKLLVLEEYCGKRIIIREQEQLTKS